MVSWLKQQKPETLTLLAAAAICAGYAIYWLVFVISWIPYPHQIDYGEGYNLFIARLWANGSWSWDLTQEPYIPLMYGPVYFVLSSWLSNAFELTYTLGRIIMAVATGISCLFVGLIAYEVSKRKLLAVIAGLLPLAHPIVRSWSIQSRVDPLAVMFSIVGIWFAVRFRNSKWFWAAPIFFVLAFYTKLDIIGPVAVFVFLALQRDWRKLVKFSAVTGGLVLAPLLLHGAMFEHLINYNVMPIWEQPIAILMPFGMFLMPAAGILILVALYFKNKEVRFSLPMIWFLASVIICSLLALKKGSSSNYYIEAIFAASLVGTLAIPWVAAYFRKRGIGVRLAYIAVIAIMFLPIVTTVNPYVFPLPDKEYGEAVVTAKRMIADTNEPVPTENAGIVVMANKKLIVEPLLTTHATNNRHWDEERYASDYERQRFDYVILRGTIEEHLKDTNGHFSARVSQAIYDNYSLVFERENERAWWYIIRVYEANRRLTDS